MPALLMDRVLKVAMPPTAATVVVPLSVPAEGLVPMAMVTLDVSLVTRLPNLSSTSTVTAGLIAAPATVLLGCPPKARWSAAAKVMLNVPEVVPGRAPSVAVRV